MLSRLALVLFAVALGAFPMVTGGCNRAGGPGPVTPQPIRDEKEPGESLDYVSAVPDTGSTSAESMTNTTTENEVEIDEGSSAGDDGEEKEGEKSADKSDDQAGDEGDEGGEDETGDEPDDIEIDGGSSP